MPSTHAPPVETMQNKSTKQPTRRVVPVIPRQLVRPKKQTSKEVKEVNVMQEAVIKPEEDVSSPNIEVEPEVATQVGQQESTAEQVQPEVLVKDKEKTGPENGHAAEEPSAVVAAQEEIPSLETDTKQTEEQGPSDQVKSGQAQQEQPVKEAALPTAPSKLSKPARGPLPPPFVPSRELHRFSSASTSAAPTFPIASDHLVNPVVEGLVFGGYRDSANISPVPGQMSASPLPPPFMNGGPVPVQNISAPHFVGEAYPSQYSFTTGPPALQQTADIIPPINAQPNQFTMNGVNYMSRTPSQASSVAFDASLGHHSNSGILTPDFSTHGYPRDPAHDPRQLARPQHLSHSSVPTPTMQQQPPMQSDITNMQAMRHYLLDRFGSFDFADYILDLAINRSLPAHSLLLTRSQGMRAIFHRARKDEGSQYWRLRISPDEYFREPNAFVDAVRYLYGGSLLDASSMLQALPPPEVSSGKTETELTARMTYVLSYVASGLTLDMSDVHVHGVQIADRLLRWDNIEPVLDLALNSRFQHTMAVQHLLRTAVDFIILNFPPNFVLDTSAPQLLSLPRLIEQQQRQSDSETSLLPQGRRQSHHRLKSIRFGDAPSDQETPFPASILSSVLISLPFEILTTIFQSLTLVDRLGRVLVTQLMYAVVDEREKRRLGSVRTYGHLSEHGQSVDSVIIQNLSWEESVGPSDEDVVGIRIVRRRVDDAAANGRR